MATTTSLEHVTDLLGDDAADLLEHRCETISASRLHLPGPDFIERVMVDTDRSTATLRNLRQIFNHGRLAGTGHLSILPVDQGIEHSAAASFAPNPDYFDPAKIVELAIEGRLQRGRVDRRRARGRVAQVRPSDPVHRQAQPQRAADLPQPLRPGDVRQRPARLGHGRGRRRRDDLLRLGGEHAPAARGLRGLRGGPPPRHVHGAVVLPAQPGVQAGRHRLPPVGRSDRSGQPPRRHDRGRHHQAEAAGEQQRLRRDEPERLQLWQDVEAGLLGAEHRPPDRPLPLPGRQLLHGSRRA